MNEVKKILNFWKEVNLLTPVTVKSITFKNQKSLSTKDVLKVPYDRIEDLLLSNNDKKHEIEIGFGDIKNTYLYEKGNIEREDFVDGDGGESFIFAFKIDGDRKYKEGSFNISKFAFILLKNLISKNYNDIEYEIKKFNENIEIDLKSYENYNVENIQKITCLILKKLIDGLDKDGLDEKTLKKSFYLKLFNSNEEEENNESSFFQMDFYTKDLENITKADLKDDSLLSNIIYSKANKNRQKIDDNKDFLEEITLPKNMPIGKWPSKFNPSLMQATAINICTSKDYSPNIFSVNGPPGTGKTTLLKEIIADTIVKKAKIIADFNSINLEVMRTNTTDSYYRNYYKIPNELKKLGIIVASNNNSAVENISKDLPKAEDILSKDTLTNLFDINEHENIYFTKDSENIFGDNLRTWGLISAPYGKKTNIQKILGILPEKKQKNEDFNFSLGNNIPNFKEAVSKFQEKYHKVIKYREDFNNDVEQFLKKKDKIFEIKNSSDEISNLKNKIENLIEELKKVQDNKEYKDSILKQKREQKSNIENSYSIFTKITNKIVGEKNPKILELNKDIEILNEELTNVNKYLRNIKNNKDELNKKIQILENSKEILKRLEEEISIFFETYSSNEDDLKLLERCSDLENFYNDIINNTKTQESCPWGVEEFNKLREELFACSLSLIEAYISNSKGIKANLKLLKLLLSGENLGYSIEERKDVFKECFHTLNLLIPVLSTTFASVSRAFKDFEENELGIVIIDEAGQATPFSAMGLLYRANRCIIVGDPLQVEPVMTVTSTLIRAIANKYELNKIEKEFNIAGKVFNYTSPSLSIQTLADYANLYYGKIGETEVGCPLVVHRRCLSPMFDISNRISYDNRMINKCMPDKVKVDYVLEKNEFIDVKGQEKGSGNHYVKEQGEKIIEIIKDCIENRGIDVFENSKNLYVISPFTTVINGLKNDIKKIFKDEDKKKIITWCDNCLGTVHKFQGKEADSVILLLGCDNNSKNSAKWAAQQANILNVAVTRAKKRFVIIGDLDLWGKLDFFKDAKDILNLE